MDLTSSLWDKSKLQGESLLGQQRDEYEDRNRSFYVREDGVQRAGKTCQSQPSHRGPGTVTSRWKDEAANSKKELREREDDQRIL